ncbi:LysR family transcriptional regulator [Ruegeria marisrubri]|uniref:LysR family transcriptional regulator n=1 Tax=Ruegeria marisrubri TaxID=1685379 RepID=A0A0X3UBH2_9RHOB|nr:LysR family transcriptional regulator [Ruegeria marisrubri]KUJ85435.1 LysR family transcriptional regulator [Ruegeria marisrubri]
MNENLTVGTSITRAIKVDRDRTIDFMGEDCRVYATPSLVRDIEHTCRDLIVERVLKGQDSVGTVVSITHTAPTLLGMEALVTVTVAEVDGRKVVFDVVAKDAVDTICKGRHERFIVDVDKTREKLRQKAARLQES